MSPQTVVAETSHHRARSQRRSLGLSGLLGVTLMSGCVDGRMVFEAFAAIAIIALLVKVRQVSLLYALATGAWIAFVKNYQIIRSGIFSDGACQLDLDLASLTPTLIVSEGITAFCLLYAALLIMGLPWGGCGVLLALATLLAVFIKLDTFGSWHIVVAGWVGGVMLVSAHFWAGTAIMKAAFAAVNDPERGAQR